MTTSPQRSALARVGEGRIDRDELERFALSDRDGALVVFCGVVRNHDGGRSVTALDYEAHPDAERFLLECCSRAAERSGSRVAAWHRIGSLTVGDTALVACVASPHRREAFVVCSELVEEIKATVPIWKRQHFADGVSEWVGL